MSLLSVPYALFVAATLAGWLLAPRALRRPLLLVASVYFYATWNAWFVAALAALALSDWAFALRIERATGRTRTLLLAGAVGANLAYLGTFKYLAVATASVSALLGMRDPLVARLFVPIGISFHTFQSISYLVDVSRGRMRARRSLLDYALYLAFFPQLLAGPIVRAERFFAELDGWHRPHAEDVLRGVREIAQGLVKKAVLADTFAGVADRYYGGIAAHPGAPAAWSAALAFSWEIYFDFSGYSDIAIGTARLFGFAFPQNFLRPYFARDVREFWQRWHVTLSSWLRDYLYIPLGGNRHGPRATTRNLFVTMLLGGLWHGAGATFVAWGGYHGLLLSLERRRAAATPPRPRLARAAGVVVTFGLVTLGWILFRARNFGDALATLHAVAAGGPGPMLLDAWSLTLAAAAFGVEGVAASGRLPPFARTAPVLQGAAIAALLLVFECGPAPDAGRSFVYFTF